MYNNGGEFRSRHFCLIMSPLRGLGKPVEMACFYHHVTLSGFGKVEKMALQ